MAKLTRPQYALIVLLAIGFVATGSVFVLFSRTIDGIRGDFCDYARAQYAATLTLPQVSGRLAAEQNDLTLIRQLGCPPKG